MADNSKNATVARPTVAGYNGLSSAIGESISQVLQGQGTVDEALKAAGVKADKALKDK
jgi:multiple sugar transport system substrate-binding protein